MNCKPGDLAIVIKAKDTPEMIGKIVNILRLTFPQEKISGRYFKSSPYEVVWVCCGNNIPWRLWDGRLIYVNERPIVDWCLRPIHPSDEQDEMLRIVGLPNKEKEKA